MKIIIVTDNGGELHYEGSPQEVIIDIIKALKIIYPKENIDGRIAFNAITNTCEESSKLSRQPNFDMLCGDGG